LSDLDPFPLVWIPAGAARKTVEHRNLRRIEAYPRACSKDLPLPGGRIPVVFVDLGAQLRVQTDVGIQLRAAVYPLLMRWCGRRSKQRRRRSSRRWTDCCKSGKNKILKPEKQTGDGESCGDEKTADQMKC
jgi:hypothetical protein